MLLAGSETFAELRARLPRFIEDVYNAKSKHSPFGHQSPIGFKAQLAGGRAGIDAPPSLASGDRSSGQSRCGLHPLRVPCG